MSRLDSFRLCPRIAFAAAAVGCLGLAGCTQVLLTGMFLLKGMETEPEFEGLKGKMTAVVCRPLVELQYSSSDAATLLAREVGSRMVQRGKKIRVVNAQKVEEWTDEHDWDKFAEVGKALKADYVVGIELEEFSLYQGQTLFQGRATVHVTVHDVNDDGKAVYEKRLDRIVYPPNSGVSTTDKTEAQFRREFTAFVAERIGRCFYPFDHRDDAALDSRALD
jgi:hypothetical protein